MNARDGKSTPTTPTPFSLSDEEGATTIEYTMVLAFMATISIFVTINLIQVLLDEVSALVVNIAVFLTGVPSP
jgi:Flp pilus assembly pilin Flp